MKLSSSFLSHQDGSETLLVPTGAAKFAGLVRSNPTAGMILACLEQETTEEQITDRLCAAYQGAERDTVRRDVARILEQLRGIGALDE
ncbi:MAG: PqqD family protein [Oscillospiraceae bacterium]|nr:PqqD family protein [Oscillospiraceae bacterium]